MFEVTVEGASAAKIEGQKLLKEAIKANNPRHQALCYRVILAADSVLKGDLATRSESDATALAREIAATSKSALQASDKAGMQAFSALFHRVRADALCDLGGLEEAKKEYAACISLCNPGRGKPQENFLEEGRASFGLGKALVASAYSQEAIDTFATAFKNLQDALGIVPETIECLTQTGLVQMSQGRYDDGLASLNSALELCDKVEPKIDKKGTLGRIHMHIAGCYHYLGQLDQALSHNDAALPHLLAAKDYVSFAHVLTSKALIYGNMHDFARAREVAQQGLMYARLAKNQDGVAFSQLAMGYIDFADGKFDSSLTNLKAALDAANTLDKKELAAWCKCGMAMPLNGMNRGAEALPFIEASLREMPQFGNQKAMTIGYALYAWTLENCGRAKASEEYYLKALAGLEELSKQVADPSEIGAFQQTLPNPYGFYARFLLRQKRPEDALAALESGKARGLSQQIALNGDGGMLQKVRNSPVPEAAADAKRLQTAIELLNSTNSQLRALDAQTDPQLLADPAFKKRKQSLAAAQSDAELKYEHLKYSLFDRYPAIAVFQRYAKSPPGPADLKKLAESHKDTLYVEWAMVDQHDTLLLTLDYRAGIHGYLLPIGEAEVEVLVKRWRSAIAQSSGTRATSTTGPASGENEPGIAREVFQKFLGPALKELTQPEVQRLVFVSDGQLGELPLGAMIDGGGKRLIQRFATSSSVSLGALALQMQGAQLEFTKSCLVVADTTGDDPSALLVKPEGRSRGEPGPLKAAREEGLAISQLFGNAVFLPGAAARESVVKKTIEDFAILHFACHGSLDTSNNMRNGLVLCAEPAGSSEDGILQAREIVGTSLRAKLAVLSACETGRGKSRGGDGIQSLAWAFQAGGCPSVVASHWQVDDTATRELMVAFYTNLRAGMAKDVALQQAVTGLMPKYAGVFWWGAFELVGNTDPLPAAIWNGH